MYESSQTPLPQPGAPAVSKTNGGGQILRNPDGSISVDAKATTGPRIPIKGDFDENLADYLTPQESQKLAGRLVEFRDVDKESRKDWETREKRALQMMGVIDINPQESKSPGTHQVVHPMLIEAAVRFQANFITEVFPPTGPVKSKILGKQTPDRVAQADRIEMFCNYYLTEVDRGYFADTDQMGLYLPMAGSAFRKAGQNWVTGLPELRYVKATNFIAPYSGTDLATMPRYCHEYTMSGDDIRRSIDSGMFAEVTLTRGSSGEAKHAPSSDTADLREAIMHQDDELYGILEYHIDLAFDGDTLAVPERRLGDTRDLKAKVRSYVVLVEEANERVLLIRRNWKEKDKDCRKRVWFAHHKYLPGLGFYGFGLPHLIGSLGNAASGVVNAILDSALASAFQGGFKTREARAAGLAGEVRLQHGVWIDVDAAYEDLAKSFYTPPFKEPGPALPNLLQSLVESGQRFAGTTDAAVGDAKNTGPVGTTIALIEQSQKPQSAIHKRIHKSMSDELAMLGELIHDYMPDRYDYDVDNDQDEAFLLKTDFDDRIDVVSVTDPNIYSDTQRIQRAQAVLELQTQAPDLYPAAKKAEAHRRMFQALKIPDIDAIGPEIEQPNYLDPVSENGMLLIGKGVTAFETQYHAAHIMIHQQGLATAQAQPMDPQTKQMVELTYGAHIRAHQALQYRQEIFAAAGIPAPPLGPDQMPLPQDPQVEAQITAAVMAKLPPPPPPAADSPEGKADQIAQASAAKIQASGNESSAKIERETQAFIADEKRKQAAHEQELSRARIAAEAQQRIDDAKAAADIRRADMAARAKVGGDAAATRIKTKVELANKQAGFQQERHHKALLTKDELRRQMAKHQGDRDIAGEVHQQQIGQAEDLHQAEIGQAEEQHKQELAHADAKHSAELAQSAASGDQEIGHAKAKSSQEIAHTGRKQSQELAHTGAKQKVELKQAKAKGVLAESAGKVKIQQAKAAAKAKAVKPKPKAKKK